VNRSNAIRHRFKMDLLDRWPHPSFSLEEESKLLADFLTARVDWNSSQPGKSRKVVVLGHLFEYGCNYTLRSLEIAFRVARGNLNNINLVLPFGKSTYPRTISLLNRISFKNITRLNTSNYFLQITNFFKSKILSGRIAKRTIDIEGLLELEFRGVRIGDLIYDDYLKRHKLATFKLSGIRLRSEIERALQFYFLYSKLLSRFNAEILVTTHLCYLEYGLLARIANSRGMAVIETTDIITTVFSRNTSNRDLNYHTGIKLQIEAAETKNIENRNQLVDSARKMLQSRLLGEVKQIDALKAYGSSNSSSVILKSLSKSHEGKTLVVLFAHIFDDSPHTSTSMVYQDYFVWLRETVVQFESIKECHLVIKPHPSSSTSQLQEIESLMLGSQPSNTTILPLGCNTNEVLQYADAVITVQGTIGLEAAALGKKVLTSGEAFYSNRGFTIDSRNITQYHKNLSIIDKLPELSESQVENALLTFMYWNQLFDWEDPLVTPRCIEFVWAGQPLEACGELLEKLHMGALGTSKLFNNAMLCEFLQ
jgi:hypothetical protein